LIASNLPSRVCWRLRSSTLIFAPFAPIREGLKVQVLEICIQMVNR
jgi:hypothetical protein